MNHLKTILVIAVAFLAFWAILTWPIEGMTTLVMLGFFLIVVSAYIRIYEYFNKK